MERKNSNKNEEFFWSELFSWFEKFGRKFPWREANDQYSILIAEVLLQQTNVRKVEDVYRRFIQKWPSPQVLRTGKIEEIEKEIEILGLKKRAENLKKCAEIICLDFEGMVPKNRENLIKLPGVGDYTADAVLCYGWGKPSVPVDTNVFRVFERFFGLKSEKSRPRTDKNLKKRISEIYPFGDTRKANLAVLDFAGEICKSVKPKCNICPLRENCKNIIEKV